LISVIGAIKLVGMWGIFLGPLIAALFYSLLRLLNTRLLEDPDPNSDRGPLWKPE
jgi:predicted PurR-regulated permease PerM